MGPEGAVNIVFRHEIAAAEEKTSTTELLVNEYRSTIATPYRAAALGFIDEIIDPKQTRPKIVRALDVLKNKEDVRPPRKHGNIPL